MSLAKYQSDFKKADYSNPVIKKDKERKFHLLKVFAFIVALIILIVLFIFLFFTPVFQLNDLTITGLNKIDKQEVEQITQNYLNQRVLFVFSRKNYFIFDCATLQKFFLNKYNLSSLTITKRFGGSLELTFVEKKSVMQVLNANDCFEIDDQGIIVANCQENSELTMKIKVFVSSLKINEPALKATEVAYLRDVYQKFSKELKNQFNIVIIEKKYNSLEVKTAQNIIFFFNIDDDFNSQFERLKVILTQKEVQSNLSNISYFDLRFGEKVYYK